MNGIFKAVIIFILILSIFNNCVKQYNEYQVSITNHYFEPMHNTRIGICKFDSTIQIGETTNSQLIKKGNYIFHTQIPSGLVFEINLTIQGKRQNIHLIFNEIGNLVQE